MVLLDRDRVCSCGRSGHEEAITGEPRINQVQDPFTRDVHGPGAVIESETGRVKFTSGPTPNDEE